MDNLFQSWWVMV